MIKKFLEIKNVDFQIGGKIKVKNFSLDIVKKGEIICLLGPSGIGKTTILRSIAGLEKVENGSIKLKSNLLSSKNSHVEPENRNISLSFQENALFPHFTIQRNIIFGTERNRMNGKKFLLILL